MKSSEKEICESQETPCEKEDFQSQQISSTSPLHLPLVADVVCIILRYLGLREMLALAQLNRDWKQFCQSNAQYNQFWWRMCVEEWFEEDGMPTKMDHKRNWKKVYLDLGTRSEDRIHKQRDER